MRLGSASEAARLAALVASHAIRGLLARSRLNRLSRWRPSGPLAERLLIAPQDLRTSDPTAAAEIYAGRFAFAGKMALAGGTSPFEVEPPSRDWAEALHAFGWLRHLRASDRALSRSNARALVLEWIGLSRRARRAAWAPHVVSRRILSWISHSPIILEGADYAFYRRFMRSLDQQVNYLSRAVGDAEDGYQRLFAIIALTQASLCMADQVRLARHSGRQLEDELKRQILPDGGHLSRHPGVLIELLLDLLPLRQAYLARNLEPPPALVGAIERMMPMLRFFRLADGGFAHFNGMGPTPTDSLATVLAYDDTRGTPVQSAPHSGYQRLQAGSAAIVVDAGPPPAPAFSRAAHAGCLSFEFASGQNWIVVNCGAPTFAGGEWRLLARATAAHSTVTLNDRSSCRFVGPGALSRFLRSPIVAGPKEVSVTREDTPEGTLLDLMHDGYVPTSGLVHRRKLRLGPDGALIEGEDAFEGEPGRDDAFAVRFHLHPLVRVERDGEVVALDAPNGERWLFESEPQAVVEESVFLARREGPRKSAQLVVEGRVLDVDRVRWRFRRVRS